MTRKPTQIIAHRGGGAGTVNPDAPPENTLAAFDWAWGHGLDACECDVQLTHDKEVVVFHDFSAKRTTGVNAAISEMSLTDLRSLDAGRWKGPAWAGHRTPTLSELLAGVPSHAELLVELKPGPQIVEPLAAILTSGQIDLAQLTLLSFNLDTIAAAKRRLPDLGCLWAITFNRDSVGDWRAHYREGGGVGQDATRPAIAAELLDTARHVGLDGFDVSAAQPPDLLPGLRDAGVTTIVWTVNEPAVARRLSNMGATGITTDLPLMLRKHPTKG